MLKKAASGFIELKGGNTTKDFVYVDDVARAFLLALETSFVGPINIGTGREIRLDYVAAEIKVLEGCRFTRVDAPNTSRMCCDATRAKTVLGWEPTVRLEEGLRATFRAAEKVAV
jgi:UDP-glucose 4-epimerase